MRTSTKRIQRRSRSQILGIDDTHGRNNQFVIDAPYMRSKMCWSVLSHVTSNSQASAPVNDVLSYRIWLVEWAVGQVNLRFVLTDVELVEAAVSRLRLCPQCFTCSCLPTSVRSQSVGSGWLWLQLCPHDEGKARGEGRDWSLASPILRSFPH